MLICFVTPHSFDFIVQNVEMSIGNSEKILKSMTFLLLFLGGYLKIAIKSLKINPIWLEIGKNDAWIMQFCNLRVK